MKEITLKVNGMHCEGCSSRLEKVLKNTEGVEDASVFLEEGKARIKFDQEKISVSALCEIVADTGFEAFI